jgi:starch synthase
LGAQKADAGLLSLNLPWGRAFFIDYPPFFDRDGLYGFGGRDFEDNDRRFILFARGVLEGAKTVGFAPEVVHSHDWQSGLLAAYLRRDCAGDPFFSGTSCVFTVHNMAYQGCFPKESLSWTGLPEADFTPEGLEFYGKISFLKAGLAFADVLSTVSPAYAREIQEPGQGCGLEGLLKSRSANLHGILNGIDGDLWDPQKDSYIPRNYGCRNFAQGKAAAKKKLLRALSLKDEPRVPLIVAISRLDYQKGLDLAVPVLEERLGRCRLVVLGTGDPGLSESLSSLSQRYPDRVHFHLGFDEPFAHHLYAAADLFLMPSRFEPCGLGQMVAMRYGAVPVASSTGGLADTVFEFPQGSRRANGFLCRPGDFQDLARALDRALGAFGRQSWGRLVHAGMDGDYSWEKSIPLYLGLFQRATLARLTRL